MSRIAETYKRISAAILTVVLLTAMVWMGLNVFLFVSFKVYDHFFKFNNPVGRKYGATLKTVYPNYSIEQIDRLLNETWKPDRFILELPLGFQEKPTTGRYVNILPPGFRRSTLQAPWPPDPNAFSIFVFGGSTTFGMGVADEETIPSYLSAKVEQAAAGKKIHVYNFARGGYRSSQEKGTFEKLILSGARPQLVIFIDGLNDFEYPESGDPNQVALIDKFISANQSFAQVAYGLRNLLVTPLMGRLSEALRRELTIRRTHNDAALSGAVQISPEESARVVDSYINNKHLIEAIAKEFDVKTLFVWQPIPYFKYDLKYHALGHLNPTRKAEFGYPVAERMLLTERPQKNFFWCADIQQTLGLQGGLYVDNVHYSPKMCSIIADQIYQVLLQSKLLPART